MTHLEERTRYLLIDVGAGTMDVIYYESPSNLHYKAVVQSPVPFMSEEAKRLSGNLLITGYEMGGGTLSEILRNRTRSAEEVMTASAAMTLRRPSVLWVAKVSSEET